MRLIIRFLILLMMLSLQTGCLYIARHDGPYHGKVVDQKTREPIEGAVVLGTWAKYHSGIAGGWTSFYDAREAVTDKNGEFIIPGQGLFIMSSVGGMEALIYKAGYTYYRSGSWSTIKEGLYSSKEVKWEGDVPIFPLRKLSEEERIKDKKISSLIPSLPYTGINREFIMRQEVNKERIHRGLEPY